MKTKIYTTLVIAVFFISKGYSQNKIFAKMQNDSVNYREIIEALPSFTIFGDNYFVTGTSINKEAFTANGSDTKFEIGFKHLITNVQLPLHVVPFMTYRQKAFWDTYKTSLPLRELNFNPTIGLARFFLKGTEINYALYLSFEHESNGRDEAFSRSWNFLSLAYFKPIRNNLQLKIKAWLPVSGLGLEGNEDITSYRGYFNIGATYKVSENIYVDLDLQPAYGAKLQGHIKTALSFRISKKANQFIYIQYYGGYSEDLINYNQSVNKIRLGFVFKDLIFNFKEK